jgi:multidrug efflux system outer membrane protein
MPFIMPQRSASGQRMVGLRCVRVAMVMQLIIMTGCSVGPTYVRPTLDIPAGWREQSVNNSEWPADDWWRSFGSPELNSFIQQARTGNLDMAAAAARIREADAQVRVAGAALLPSVDIGGSASRNQSVSSKGSKRTTTDFTSYTTQLNASYEIDFWGANRASLEAAKQAAVATRYDAETIALTTDASIATVYFQILASRDQIATMSKNLQNAKEVLAVLKAQESAGTATALDVAQQQTTVLTIAAELPPLQEQLRQNINAMAILLGKAPQAVDVNSGSLTDLSHPSVAPGLPSALLARRPDVAAAEAQLKAANADIAVARAAFFPTIQLTAQAGFESAALSSLFGPAGLFYSLAAGVTQPIFEGGRLEGNYQFSKAFYDELVADYRQSVISAFQDVEDSLVAYQQTTEQEKRQQAAVVTARHAYDAAAAQLRAGTTNVLTVLNTESTLFAADLTLVQVRLARLNAIVSLFKALGGGWQQGGSVA